MATGLDFVSALTAGILSLPSLTAQREPTRYTFSMFKPQPTCSSVTNSVPPRLPTPNQIHLTSALMAVSSPIEAQQLTYYPPIQSGCRTYFCTIGKQALPPF